MYLTNRSGSQIQNFLTRCISKLSNCIQNMISLHIISIQKPIKFLRIFQPRLFDRNSGRTWAVIRSAFYVYDGDKTACNTGVNHDVLWNKQSCQYIHLKAFMNKQIASNVKGTRYNYCIDYYYLLYYVAALSIAECPQSRCDNTFCTGQIIRQTIHALYRKAYSHTESTV